MNNIKIQSGRPLYGKAELSGDPLDSIVLSTLAIFSSKPVEIGNIPRCESVLDYFEILRSSNIKVEWIAADKIKIFVDEQLNSDLSGLITPENQDKIGLLVPAILFRSKECTLNSSLRSELKFYREMGIEVSASYNRFHLKLPLSNLAVAQKRVNLHKSYDLLLASRLLFQRIYPELSVVYKESSTIFKYVDYNISSDIQSSYIVGHNKIEFRMLTAAAIISKGEIDLSKFQLTDSVEYLLELEKIGCSYEVHQNKIKIWYETKKLDLLYDFSNHDISEIAYYALLLSLFSKHTIQIICQSDQRLEEIIKDLNIIGCRIDIKDQNEHLVLKLRTGITIAPFKSEISSPFWGGLLVASAMSVNGTSHIRKFNLIKDYVPDVLEKMKSLHIDVFSV